MSPRGVKLCSVICYKSGTTGDSTTVHRNSPVSAFTELNNPFCVNGDDVVVVDMNGGGLSGIDDGEWPPRSPLGMKPSSIVTTRTVLVDSSIRRRPVGLKVCTCASAMVRGVETRVV